MTRSRADHLRAFFYWARLRWQTASWSTQITTACVLYSAFLSLALWQVPALLHLEAPK